MLGQHNRDGSKPKCFFTESSLPAYVDHTQPPTKKKPFSTVLNQTFSHTLDVVLPETIARAFRQGIANGANRCRYARVHMKPIELIEGEFFNHYIKLGDIIMLSQGIPGIDNVFSLAHGILRLEVNKSTYERMGLQGTPTPSHGRKHVKARYVIEFNLRLPSMVHGKKGFERIVWAFKNVLNTTVTWLLCDLQSPIVASGPLGAHHPTWRDLDPVEASPETIAVPNFAQDVEEEADTENVTALLEWLSLVFNSSPRVSHNDDPDVYICRYRMPGLVEDGMTLPNLPTQNLIHFRWHGLLPPTYITKILFAASKAADDGWFAMSAVGFTGVAYTVLKHQDKILTWEVMD
ncbi:Hypothetical protein R9X50_00245700 [Acrodontium crateriforme]|uniref:Uncharacterized protein n=1 Tax=Acrodontium crateriforme TaxID=150365 RepID=A0AAQ3R6N9_9PEZI|nr:Hypothetical protein R9X50_00245700 [Acrodontium crateriforme]